MKREGRGRGGGGTALSPFSAAAADSASFQGFLHNPLAGKKQLTNVCPVILDCPVLVYS